MSANETSQDRYHLIGSEAFAKAFVQLLAGSPHPPHEWWLCAEQLDNWPLEQPELAAALVSWSKAVPQGRVQILAKNFSWVEREAARFMNWRRLFAHQVFVKRWPQRVSDELQIPRGVFAERHAVELGFHPTGQLVACWLDKPSQIAAHRNALQALWDKGQQALPAYTLGL